MKSLFRVGLVALGLALTSQTQAIPVSGGFAAVGTTEDNWFVGLQYQRLNFTDSGRGQWPVGSGLDGQPIVGADFTAHVTLGAISYHINKNQHLFAIFPYVRKDFKIPAGNLFPLNWKLESMIDPIFGTLYRLYHTQGQGWFFSTAVLFSVQAPVAEHQRHVNSAPTLKISRGFQNGRGNWAPTIAIPFFYEDIRKMVTLNLAYTSPIKGYQYRHPNQLEYDLSTSYKVYPWIYESEVVYPFDVKLTLEFLGNYSWNQSTRNTGQDFNNNDLQGNLIKVAPGIMFEGLAWSVAFQYQHRLTSSTTGHAPVRFKDSIVLQWFYEIG